MAGIVEGGIGLTQNANNSIRTRCMIVKWRGGVDKLREIEQMSIKSPFIFSQLGSVKYVVMTVVSMCVLDK